MRSRLAFAAIAVLVGHVGLVACARHRTVTVSVSGPARYSGFNCVDVAGRPLLARARTAGRVTLVADYLRAPININAPGEVLLDACASADCAPIAGSRSTYAVSLDELSALPPAAPLPTQLAALFGAALGWDLTRDAPDGTVIVRIVATTQPPDELGPRTGGRYAPLAIDRLVGCAISAPNDLDVAEGPVYLSLPALDQCTTAHVARCANPEPRR